MPSRKAQVNVRLTEEELAKLKTLAASYGLEISDYLRLILKLGRLPKPK